MTQQTKDSAFRNCAWGYKCSKSWSMLSETENTDVRFCHDCHKEVYWVNTKAELTKNVLLNRCVCFPLKLIQSKKLSIKDLESLTVGEVSADLMFDIDRV